MREGTPSDCGHSKIKPLDDLTLMDDYMFGVVMSDPDNLKPLIERILGIRIRTVEFIEAQKSEKEGYASRGVRLDLYVVDDSGRIFNVEVQASSKKNLPKRMRYYQSVIDVNVLSPGVNYCDLRRSAVIFICNYDPFGDGRCVYSFENRCVEDLILAFGDESLKVVANTKGEVEGVDGELAELIRYLDGGEPTGDYTRQLEDAVARVKASEERRHEYMVTMIRDMEIREEGVEQGIAQGVERERLESIKNVMKSLGVDAGEAMRILGIPDSDRKYYLDML